MNYTYILECSDNTFYTGWTNDIVKRVSAHNQGKGGKYTKIRRPVKLVHLEVFETKNQAMSREWEIKHRLTREEKIQLINDTKDSKELKNAVELIVATK